MHGRRWTLQSLKPVSGHQEEPRLEPPALGRIVLGFWDSIGVLPVRCNGSSASLPFSTLSPKATFISGELHVKSGQTVSLRMEARDVIHALLGA